jgi:hypothetical protein
MTMRRNPLANGLILAGVAVAGAGSAVAGLGVAGSAVFIAAAVVLLYAGFVSSAGGRISVSRLLRLRVGPERAQPG